MLDLVDLQRAAGHEVELFGMDHPDNPPQRFAAHFPSSTPHPLRRAAGSPPPAA